MAKVSTSISLDAEIKVKAQELFADFGLDLSTAVNIFLRQAIREQRIPFEVRLDVPNSATREALDELHEMMAHPEKYKRYGSFTDALSEVLGDA
ncbi:MAG: type II toxin-antitoxin system RelB/DinJ family antitoxin [Ruminococcaceae bacterium]|nr:type II toxin-antitoxin system RelB/DinJ family antitoxin [Oscillospiraceae bacterium]